MQVTQDEELLKLQERLSAAEEEIALLKRELDFLRSFPAVAQGLKGEQLVARYTGGVVTGHKDTHDVIVESGERIEVKFSRLNTPGPSKTKRWNWIRLLGHNEAKQYEWLVLIGEKDARYLAQYPPDLPYVFFLVPRDGVGSIRSTGKLSVALNTNLASAKAPQSVSLKRYLVRSENEFKNVLAKCGAA